MCVSVGIQTLAFKFTTMTNRFNPLHKIGIFLILVSLTQNISFAQTAKPFSKKKISTPTTSVEFKNKKPEFIDASNLFYSSNEFKSIPYFNPIQSSNKIQGIGDVDGVVYGEHKLPKFIFVKNGSSSSNIEEALNNYISQHPYYFSSNSEIFEWRKKEIISDDLGMTHLKTQQYYKGIRVWNAELIAHFKSNILESINGNIIPVNPLNVDVSIDYNLATTLANNYLGVLKIENRKSEIEKLLEEKSELVIYQNKLVYHVTTYKNNYQRWEVFIDANNMQVLKSENTTCADGPATATVTDLNNTSRTINTYLKSGNYYLLDASRTMFAGGVIPSEPKGAIVTFDMKNTPNSQTLYYISTTNNTWTDKTAISAHFNGGQAYEYFKTAHARNSLDGAGGNIYSVINVPEENGSSMENAYWNGQFMSYGNGGTSFKPLAGGLDVAAHEMTHGVVEKTANLEYKFQSGAINESMADIFGTMVDRDDWRVGEDVVKLNAFPSGALRDLADPHNGGTNLNSPGWQPSHMNEYVQLDETQDHGGVHINSGIPNKAYYLYATAITKDKAEKVYYRALNVYLTRSSNFADLRLAVVKAAGDLYGVNSNEVTQAGLAFDGVGIGGSGGTGGNVGVLTINPGTEFMLVHDATVGVDPNSIYIVSNPASPSNTDYHPIATLDAMNKPSVVDNGSEAFFVATDLKPYSITLNSSNPTLSAQSNFPDWNNIAVSKDGNRIALISKFIDTAIFVYDYNSQQLAKYHLYNPSTVNGQTSDGPMYANALEWDYTGNYLIYDAYNLFKRSNGDTLDFGDVGIIKVWDKSSNNFGDGTITKIFSALPDGLSIGNPSISKNSPNIIAFDTYNENDNSYSVIAVNIETGDIGSVFQNNTLGYPTYNKLDNGIDFTYYEPTTQTINVAKIAMGTNKITPSGQAAGLIQGAMWPVFYANGNRVINVGVDNSKLESTTLKTFPNPFSKELTIEFKLTSTAKVSCKVLSVLGQIVSESDVKYFDKGEHQININTNKVVSGIYFMELNVDGERFIQKIVK